MLKPVFAATALVLAAGAAHAQGSSPAEVVQRHVDSGGNLDAALADVAGQAADQAIVPPPQARSPMR